MPVNNLIDFGTAAVDAEEEALEQGRLALAEAQTRARTTRAAIAADLREIEPLEREVAALRQRLSADTSTADTAARLRELVERLATLRRRRAAVAEQEVAAAEAAADVGAADTRVRAAGARLNARARQLADAEAVAARRAAFWAAALAAPPLSDAPARASALLDRIDDALDTLETRVPAPLLDAVRARHAAAYRWRLVASAILASAEDAGDRAEERTGGVSGAAAREMRAYGRALEAVSDFVLRVPSLLADADVFAAAPMPVVSDEEAAALDDAGEKASREAAATLEEALHQARVEEAAALRDRNADELRKLNQPTHDAQPAIDAHDAAVQAREQAARAFTNDEREKVFAWQATAPDAVWSYVARAEELRARLQPVKAATVAKLLTDVDEADERLAKALDKAEAKRRTVVQIQDRLTTAELRARARLDGPTVRSV